jgi:uncharacterized protein (TIGR03790 family)
MKTIRAAALLVVLAVTPSVRAATEGESVAVIYNKNLPESRRLAEYYASKRGVPAKQLFGVNVSATSEQITRDAFNDKLKEPIYDWLVSQKLITLNKRPKQPVEGFRPIGSAKVRYLVLSYGIPLKVTRDPSLKEEAEARMQPELRGRNEAAVDAELAVLPTATEKFPVNGIINNPFYLATNAAAMHPTNGILLVARLDGQSAELARGLIDKALEAEANGLWGRAYIDTRSISNEYKTGDDWLRAGAEITRRLGYDTTVDTRESTFPAGFPMSHIAFYAGWYDVHASGPFAETKVEFMPGAFAYHLHSLSAYTVRGGTHWVGPLLARGATITMGSVEEPYLLGTPNIAVFLERIGFRGFTFGEAAYACQSALSWQTTVIGDPLYRPLPARPDVLHQRLEKEQSPLAAWSHLRVIQLNEATGAKPEEVLGYLRTVPQLSSSALLQEKLGDVLRPLQPTNAVLAYASALRSAESPNQKLRLLLTLGELYEAQKQDERAFETYREIANSFPQHPNRAAYARQLAALAEKLGRADDAVRWRQEAERTPK